MALRVSRVFAGLGNTYLFDLSIVQRDYLTILSTLNKIYIYKPIVSVLLVCVLLG